MNKRRKLHPTWPQIPGVIRTILLAVLLILLGAAVERVIVLREPPKIVTVVVTATYGPTPTIYITRTPVVEINYQTFIWNIANATLMVPVDYQTVLRDPYYWKDVNGQSVLGIVCQDLVIMDNASQSGLRFTAHCQSMVKIEDPCPADAVVVLPATDSTVGIVRYYSDNIQGWFYTTYSKGFIGGMKTDLCSQRSVLNAGKHDYEIRSFYSGEPELRDRTLAIFDKIVLSFRPIP